MSLAFVLLGAARAGISRVILMRDARAAGADLKQGAWLHLACGVWTPEVYFEQAAELQGPRLDNLTIERVELCCGICKQVHCPAARLRPLASIETL